MKDYSIKLLKMNRKDIKNKLRQRKHFAKVAQTNAPWLVSKHNSDIKFYEKILIDLNDSIKRLDIKEKK